MFQLNEENQIIKKDTIIEALYLGREMDSRAKELLRHASPAREWMSQKGQEYSYHCVPLTHANQLGYWIINNADITVYWDGGDQISNIKITAENRSPGDWKLESAHFTIGIITFSIPFIFKTQPGWGLYVGPCPNQPIDGLQGLEAIVETNWLPFTFTMNYKITEKNKVIKIPKGLPICRIFPFPLNLNEKTKLEIKSINEYPKLKKAYSDYSESRNSWNAELKAGTAKLSAPSDARQKFYKYGTDSSGNSISDGFHKMDYRYQNVDYKINIDDIKKCPYLSYVSKFKNFFKKD